MKELLFCCINDSIITALIGVCGAIVGAIVGWGAKCVFT